MTSVKNQFQLFYQRRFLPLFVTQFFGAMNDNLFKNALIILFAFNKPESTNLNQNTLINIAASLFIIPYFLFSAIAGQLADKYEKSRLISITKLVEVLLAALGVIGFYYENVILLMSSLFLLGTQATFFGPLKYSILPQHLTESELVGGNGLVEMGTFIAILIGGILAGFFLGFPNTGITWVSALIMFIALVGFSSSLFIPKASPSCPGLTIDWNLLRQSILIVKDTTQDKFIFYAIIGISWFWMYGSIVVTQIANYTKLTLGGDQRVATLILVAFSVGIGLGSILCERLSGRKIEIGIVPLGAVGLSIFALDIPFANSLKPDYVLDATTFLSYGHNWRVLLDAVLMGTFGGIYLVPLYALLQKESRIEFRSRVIAANNIVNALFMTFASFMTILILNIGFNIPDLFFFTGVLNAIVALYIFIRVPEFVVRFMIWLLVTTAYRITHQDLKNIPAEGQGILLCQSISRLTPLVVMGACRRHIRFVISKDNFKHPILRYIYKITQAIPANQSDFFLKKEIKETLDKGGLIGLIMPVDPKIEAILQELKAPVIPIKLEQSPLLQFPGHQPIGYKIDIVALNPPSAVILNQSLISPLFQRGDNLS